MNQSTIISIVVSLALVGVTYYIVSLPSAEPSGGSTNTANVEMREGVQYVTVTAGGGYYPKSTEITGGVPTKLVVKTNGTYDCSAALVVRSRGYEKMLDPTGEEVIDLGTPATGETIQGTCSMGMYGFELKAK